MPFRYNNSTKAKMIVITAIVWVRLPKITVHRPWAKNQHIFLQQINAIDNM
jgi:hypothetical protein